MKNEVEEKFVPINGMNGRYEISNLGRVKSIKKSGRQMILKNYLGNWGYYASRMGKKHYRLVHRIVAEHFVENPNPKEFIEVNHLDGNKLNNESVNLEWCTHKMNSRHAFDMGLNSSATETNRWAKLSNSDILEIKRLASIGKRQFEIAKIYELHQCHVSRILNNKRRKYG